MEFLGVGYQELLLVLVLLLVVVGPERMPQMAYQIGRAVREMQKYARAVRDEFRDEMDYIQEQYDTVKGEVDDARRSLREETQKFDSEMRSISSEVDNAIPDEIKNPNKVIPISSGAVANRPTNGSSPTTGEAARAATEPATAANVNATEGSEQAKEPEKESAKKGGDPPLVF